MVTSAGELKGFSTAIAHPQVALLIGAGASKGLGFRLMGHPDYAGLIGEFREHLSQQQCDGILDHVGCPHPERPNLEDVFEQIMQISASVPSRK